MFQIQRLAAGTIVCILLGGSTAHADDPTETPSPTPAVSSSPSPAPTDAAIVSPGTSSGPASGGKVAIVTVPGTSGPIPIWFGPTRATVLTERSITLADGRAAATYEVLVPAGDVGAVDVSVDAPADQPTETTGDDYTYLPSPGVDPLTPTEPQCGPAFRFDVDAGDPPLVGTTVRVGGRPFRITQVDADTFSFFAPRPAFPAGVKFLVTRAWGTAIGYLQDGCFSRLGRTGGSPDYPGIRSLGTVTRFQRHGRLGDRVSVTATGVDATARLSFGASPGDAQQITAPSPFDPERDAWRVDAAPLHQPLETGEVVGPIGHLEVAVRTSDGKLTYGQTAAENDYEVLPWDQSLRSVTASGPLAGGNTIRVVLTGEVLVTPEIFIGGRRATAVKVRPGIDPFGDAWDATLITATAPAGTTAGPVEVRIPSRIVDGRPGGTSLQRDLIGTYTYEADAPPPSPTPSPDPVCSGPSAPDEAVSASTYAINGSTSIRTLFRGALALTGRLEMQRCDAAGTFTGRLTMNPTKPIQLRTDSGPALMATVAFVPTGPVTGTIDRDGNVRGVVKLRIKLPSVTVLGIELATGSNCQAKLIASITLTGAQSAPESRSSALSGTFPVSQLSGCAFMNGLLAPDTSGTSNVMAMSLDEGW